MLHIVEHPCIKAKLTILRDRGTPCPRFRRCVQEITGFIACEAGDVTDLAEAARPFARCGDEAACVVDR